MSDELEQLRSENSRLRASNKRLTEHILGPIVDVLPLLLQLPPERGGLGAEMRQRLSDAFGAENATLIVETKMGKSGVDWAKVPEVMSPDELPLFHQNLD